MYSNSFSKIKGRARNDPAFLIISIANLRLAGYADWRLPNPDEADTAVVVELMMRLHSRDVYAYFDRYWSSDPTVLLSFNYYPSQGKEISRVSFPRKGAKAFARAVRSLVVAKPDSGG